MSRRKPRLAFDQVSEFYRGWIVAYRDCGLPFKEIGSRVGETKQLYCRYVSVECRRVRRTDVVDHIHLSVPLHQSGLSERRTLLGLSLTQNHRRIFHQWRDEEGGRWQNRMKLSLLTSHASICNTTMVGLESGDTVARGC
ncbi:HTH_38 domain-containing protein [Trichonephila clavipes]|nr:HTH_38 domain-containing protein [Trichonephila clavipes]